MAAVFIHRSRSACRVPHADEQLEMGGSTRSFLPSWSAALHLAVFGATAWALVLETVALMMPG